MPDSPVPNKHVAGRTPGHPPPAALMCPDCSLIKIGHPPLRPKMGSCDNCGKPMRALVMQ